MIALISTQDPYFEMNTVLTSERENLYNGSIDKFQKYMQGF